MAKSNNKKAGIGNAEKVGIGVALTTAAVAAAGAYFLYGSSNAKSNRKKVKGWMLKAKGEVLDVLEQAGKMSAEEYQVAVDKIAAGYSQLKTVSKADMADFRKEMMANWQRIAKQAKPAKKAAKKAVKKAVKKATK